MAYFLEFVDLFTSSQTSWLTGIVLTIFLLIFQVLQKLLISGKKWKFLSDELLKLKMNNNTDRTLDVVFSRFRGFSFTITLRQKPKWVRRRLSFCLVIQRGMRVAPLGCFRIIVNEKLLNLEKTTASVLSALLWIYS